MFKREFFLLFMIALVMRNEDVQRWHNENTDQCSQSFHCLAPPHNTAETKQKSLVLAVHREAKGTLIIGGIKNELDFGYGMFTTTGGIAIVVRSVVKELTGKLMEAGIAIESLLTDENILILGPGNEPVEVKELVRLFHGIGKVKIVDKSGDNVRDLDKALLEFSLSEGINMEIYHADAMDMREIGSNSVVFVWSMNLFDIGNIFGILSEEEAQKVLIEMNRVLKLGGIGLVDHLGVAHFFKENQEMINKLGLSILFVDPRGDWVCLRKTEEFVRDEELMKLDDVSIDNTINGRENKKEKLLERILKIFKRRKALGAIESSI